ncbi:MAG: DUF1566 domain-containing protein [Gammaproteobacteria bacterium]|nr:DUF1566 domain-containing protein [Gammaproteobacteria bacterium]
MKRILGVLLFLVFASGAAQASLIDRGGGFIYDDVLDITWTQDANINGYNTWDNQVAWAAGLSIVDTRPGAGGVTYSDWRLPTTLQPDASCDSQLDPGGSFPLQGYGTGCTGSEMGHLFNVDGISSSSMGLFTNVRSGNYWSGTEYAPNTVYAWDFIFGNGFQDVVSKLPKGYAWAVRAGDVAAVPLPAAVWLFGTALMGLLGMRRVRR